MPGYNSPTMAESAIRGIACRCPLPVRAMKSLLIALQFHHKAVEGRPIDREPR